MTDDESTVPGLLRGLEGELADRALLIRGHDRLTHADARRRSSDLARGLIALGAGKGTHVGVRYPDGPDCVVALLAAARIGAVVVPVPVDAGADATRHLLIDGDIEILLSADDRPAGWAEIDRTDGAPILDPRVPSLRHVVVDHRTSESALDLPAVVELGRSVPTDLLEAIEDDVVGSDPLAILYRREAARGAIHTHAGLIRHHAELASLRGHPGNDIDCSAALSGVDGFGALLAALVAGTAVRLTDRSESQCLPGESGRHTEAGGAVLVGSRPVTGLDIAVVDPATGHPVAVGEMGELLLRGPYLMLRHHRRSREECFDLDGWWHTADLVRRDESGAVSAAGRTATETEPPTGPVADSPAPHTVAELMRRNADLHPSKPMVIDPDGQLTYSELDESTRTLAAAFVEAGVGKGTRVGVLLPNNTRWVRVAVALARVGAVLVPLSTLLSPRELVAQLATASVQFLVATEEFRGHRYLDDLAAALAPEGAPAPIPVGDDSLLHRALPALRRVRTPEQLDGSRPGPRALAVVDALARQVTAADDLVVIFTSGSSGPPKGVVHSHGSALAAVTSTLQARCIDADTRLYLPMPFFWVGGFGAGILSALAAGATLVTEEIPAPASTLRLLERERVTLFRGWPDQAVAVAREAERVATDLSSLLPGSLDALLPPDQRAEPGSRANLFGMTESFGPYCGFPADTDMPRSAWGSCGRPFDGVEVRVVGRENGRAVAEGTVGEIQLRGSHMLRGICRRAREDVFTPDGYYPTGDLGRLDPDGFLFYQGRSDDMFKVSGATVYPSEVQAALRTVDGVRGAFVTNLPGRSGERVAAAVVCETGRVDAEHLRGAARTVLSSFKVPSVWLLLDTDESIPRGATGKVDVRRLRELLSATHDDTRPEALR